MGPFSIGRSLTPLATSHKWMVESRELQTKSETKREIKRLKFADTILMIKLENTKIYL